MADLALSIDPNTCEQQATLNAGEEPEAVRQVTMVYKNHLDIGFTESVAKVTHDAINWLLGVAINLDQQLREHDLRFVWTTPSWVIWEALETGSAESRSCIEQAAGDGCLAWHALPFTAHTELLDEQMLEFSLSLSRMLDKRFGRRTRSAKLTDVPGHTIGLVPALADAGVELLHIGVNHMSALCQLPEAFRWRHPASGKEVVVFYGTGYGGTHHLPGESGSLVWRMVGDNCEVPTLHDVLADYRQARKTFPAASIQIGRMEDYVGNDLFARAAELPVIEQELGDSWIHGTGSDPWKSQRFRALQRLRRQWIQSRRISNDDKSYVDFGKNLNLIAEHTWGVNFNAHNYHDNTNWNNSDFHAIRHRGHIRVIEGSWQEQRDYLELACESLPEELNAEAQAAVDACAVSKMNREDWPEVDVMSRIEVPGGYILIDAADGSIRSHVYGNLEYSAGRLGQYSYQTFDQKDCERFCSSYNRGAMRLEEFTKSGLEASDAVSRWWHPELVTCRRRESEELVEVCCLLQMPEVTHQAYGAPEYLELLYSFSRRERRIDFCLQWFNKTATRLPEASWWSFQPVVQQSEDWRLHKCGQWIDPNAVVERGGRELHGVQSGVRNGEVMLETLDAHLVAPGRPQLYRFDEGAVSCEGGVHLNLHNNCWGTNFVMWCADDMRFRASLAWC